MSRSIWSGSEKKTAELILEEVMDQIQEEVHPFLERALRDREKEGAFDLEAVETAVKDTMLRCGAHLLTRLLEEEDGQSLGRDCSCGGFFGNVTTQSKIIRSILGPVPLRRLWQRCELCRSWRVPKDMVLDVVNTIFSPGLRRMMAQTGGSHCFEKAKKLIAELARVELTAKEVERVAEATGEEVAAYQQQMIQATMAGNPPQPEQAPSTLYIEIDGTGVPVLRRETLNRKGKAPDQIARTREAKLASLFTQSLVSKDGQPVRDPHSTTYVGQIESASSFGPRVYTEALRRGLDLANRTVVLGDGAVWIWNLADEHFPGATQIIDFYHAKEHLSDLCKILFPHQADTRHLLFQQLADWLWDGQIDSLLHRLASLTTEITKQAIESAKGYFENNQYRMRYHLFRQQGFFIGSGVVEAGCRSVIGQRLKQSGMHWSVRGANAIIDLRCTTESGSFEDFWVTRHASGF